MNGTVVGVDEIHARYPLEDCNGPDCHVRVRRVQTEAGRRAKLDPDPVPDAPVVIRRHPDGDVRAIVLAGHDHRDADEATWREHVCRPRRRHALCLSVTCRAPLDVVLAQLPTWEGRWHANCAPTPTPRPRPADTGQEELELP